MTDNFDFLRLAKVHLAAREQEREHTCVALLQRFGPLIHRYCREEWPAISSRTCVEEARHVNGYWKTVDYIIPSPSQSVEPLDSSPGISAFPVVGTAQIKRFAVAGPYAAHAWLAYAPEIDTVLVVPK